MRLKTIVSTALTLSIFAGLLSGCGRTQKDASPEPSMEKSAYIYETAAFPLNPKFSSIESVAAGEQSGYVAGRMAQTTETGEYDWSSVICHVDLQTGDWENLPVDLGKAEISSMELDGTGNLFVGMTAEDGASCVWKLDAGGTILEQIPVTQIPKGSYLEQLAVDAQGNLYASDYETVFARNAENQSWTETPTGGGDLITLNHQRPALVTQSAKGKGATLQIFDSEKQSLGAEIKLPEQVWQLHRGFGDFDYTYQLGDGLYGGSLDSQNHVKLLSWLECGMDGNSFRPFVLLEDGRIVGIEERVGRTEGEGDGYSMVVLKPKGQIQLSQKQTLTLACIGMDYRFKPLVVDFNRSHPHIEIVIQDYTELVPDAEAVTKLNTEILAGKIPDLLLTRALPVQQYAKQGVLADLWPMIEHDPELGRDGVMAHVLDTMAMDGKLYEITDSFMISTATCSKELVGDRTQWTIPEMMEIYGTLEPDASIMGVGMNKQSVLLNALFLDLDTYLNWEQKTCRFDTPEFVELLKLANRFPLEFDEEEADEEMQDDYGRLQAGKQLMHPCVLEAFSDYQTEQLLHDGKAAFIGYPSASGHGTCFIVNSGLAITTACKNQEAAWEFARQLLTEESNMGFPINRKQFEAYAERCMTPQFQENPQSGKMVELPFRYAELGDQTVPIYAMTQADYEGFLSVCETCKTVQNSDQQADLYNLILEECGVFFAGQKGAEETAAIIQDRVGLYLMEQRN